MGQFAALYNTRRWRKIRAAQLQQEPVCRMCSSLGRVSEATVADHIRPHRGDVDKFFYGALQSLCAPCHNRHKKMQELGNAMGCDAQGLPLDVNHRWNDER